MDVNEKTPLDIEAVRVRANLVLSGQWCPEDERDLRSWATRLAGDGMALVGEVERLRGAAAFDLEAIRARAEAAMAGPWTWRESPSGFLEFYNADGRIGWPYEATAFEFAAHARTDIPALIEYLSGFMTLQPGDLILTGTPDGVVDCQPGDHIVTQIEHIGALENTIHADQ